MIPTKITPLGTLASFYKDLGPFDGYDSIQVEVHYIGFGGGDVHTVTITNPNTIYSDSATISTNAFGNTSNISIAQSATDATGTASGPLDGSSISPSPVVVTTPLFGSTGTGTDLGIWDFDYGDGIGGQAVLGVKLNPIGESQRFLAIIQVAGR